MSVDVMLQGALVEPLCKLLKRLLCQQDHAQVDEHGREHALMACRSSPTRGRTFLMNDIPNVSFAIDGLHLHHRITKALHSSAHCCG